MKEVHNKPVEISRKRIYSIKAFFSFWEDDEGYHAELSIPRIEKPIRVVSNYPETAKSWLWREAHKQLDWRAVGMVPREAYGFAYSEFKLTRPDRTCFVSWIPGSFEDKLHKLFKAELKRTGASWYNDVSAWYDPQEPTHYYDWKEDPINSGFSVGFWRSHYVVNCGDDTLEKYLISYEDDGEYTRFFIMAIQWLRKFPSLPKKPTPKEIYEEGLRDIDNMDCPDWFKTKLRECLAKPYGYED